MKGIIGLNSQDQARGFRLSDLDLSRTMSKDRYGRRLSELQKTLRAIQVAYRSQNRWAVIVLEGWDAAGKGGAIRRMSAVLDPRGAHVWPIGAPEPNEIRHHYLWRFWQRLPARGELAIFDRSWYGRVLVERVESLVDGDTWRRAYDEICGFEQMLVDEGVRVIKVFLHISEEEQARRFRERALDPEKRWKLSVEDFRNRDQHGDYIHAVEEMIARTAIKDAPWFVVASDDKKFSRIAVIDTITSHLAEGVDLSPPALPDDVAALLAENFPEEADQTPAPETTT